MILSSEKEPGIHIPKPFYRDRLVVIKMWRVSYGIVTSFFRMNLQIYIHIWGNDVNPKIYKTMTIRGHRNLYSETFSDDEVHNSPRVISMHNILVIRLTFTARQTASPCQVSCWGCQEFRSQSYGLVFG